MKGLGRSLILGALVAASGCNAGGFSGDSGKESTSSAKKTPPDEEGSGSGKDTTDTGSGVASDVDSGSGTGSPSGSASSGPSSDTDLGNGSQKPIEVQDDESCTEGKDVITFESLPNGAAVEDGLEIGDQFAQSHGVTFELEGGGLPKVAKVGAPQTAFRCANDAVAVPCNDEDDGIREDATAVVGTWFLTDDGVAHGKITTVVVRYAKAVAAASGIVLDPDGDERWFIRGFDEGGAIVAEQELAAAPNKVNDGRFQAWKLEAEGASIVKIAFVPDPEHTTAGFALDRFSPSKACDTTKAKP